MDFDYGMAPGVKKTFIKRYRMNLSRALELLLNDAECDAHANELVAQTKAMKLPLWRASRPLAVAETPTARRHSPLPRGRPSTSRPRQELAMCSSAEAVDREADTTASTKT